MIYIVVGDELIGEDETIIKLDLDVLKIL